MNGDGNSAPPDAPLQTPAASLPALNGPPETGAAEGSQSHAPSRGLSGDAADPNPYAQLTFLASDDGVTIPAETLPDEHGRARDYSVRADEAPAAKIRRMDGGDRRLARHQSKLALPPTHTDASLSRTHGRPPLYRASSHNGFTNKQSLPKTPSGTAQRIGDKGAPASAKSTSSDELRSAVAEVLMRKGVSAAARSLAETQSQSFQRDESDAGSIVPERDATTGSGSTNEIATEKGYGADVWPAGQPTVDDNESPSDPLELFPASPVSPADLHAAAAPKGSGKKPVPRSLIRINLQMDLLSNMDNGAEEVRAALGNTEKWRQLGLAALRREHGMLVSMSEYRRAYCLLRAARREPTRTNRFLAMVRYWLDWEQFEALVVAQLTDGPVLAAGMLFGLFVDIAFSVLYLAEVQLDYPRYNLGPGYPHWLFVSRPPVIWYIALSFSTFDLLATFFFIMRWSQSMWRVLLEPFLWFNLLTAVPFLTSVFFTYGNELYVPYFLRLWVVLLRLRGVLRLHKGHTRIVSDFTERTIILVVTIINILFTALCAFQYFEMMTPPAGEFPLRYSVIESFYFIVITASTVGYGDITPSSTASQIVVMLLIVVALAVLPGLISALADAARMSGGASRSRYHNDVSPFVVVAGSFHNPLFLSDLLATFFQRASEFDNLKILLLATEKLPNALRGLINSSAYENRVSYRVGSLLEERDVSRYNIRRASAVFLLANEQLREDPRMADHRNMLSAWGLAEYAPTMPLYVYTALGPTEMHVAPFAAAIACVSDLTQLLLGYTCLYRGMSTLLLNLLMPGRPKGRLALAWEAQYADGFSHEIYCCALNPIFVDVHFNQLALQLYAEFQVVLFAVNAFNPETNERILILNPGHSYRMDANDQCVLIATSPKDILKISQLTMAQYRLATRIRPLSTTQSARTSQSALHTHRASDLNTPTPSMSNYNRYFVDVSAETTVRPPSLGYPSRDVPLCHLLKTPRTSAAECTLEDARQLRQHVIVITFSFSIVRFLCTLRAAQISSSEFRPVLLLAPRLPTDDEFQLLCEFPKLYIMAGQCQNHHDLERANVAGSEKVVIFSTGRATPDMTPMIRSERPTLFDTHMEDATAVIVSTMIDQMFSSSGGHAKQVIVELAHRDHVRFIPPTVRRANAQSQALALDAIRHQLREGFRRRFLSSSAGPADRGISVEERKAQLDPTLTPSDNDDALPAGNVGGIATRKWLNAKRQLGVHGFDTASTGHLEYVFASTYAAGRVLFERAFDTILFEAFLNPVTLAVIKALCGVRYQETIKVFEQMQLEAAYLCYIDVPEGFEDRPYGELFAELAGQYSIIPLGLYRAANDLSLCNPLPFVYTNPLASVLVKSTDLVYVLKTGSD